MAHAIEAVVRAGQAINAIAIAEHAASTIHNTVAAVGLLCLSSLLTMFLAHRDRS